MPDPIGSLMVILTIGAISFGLLNGHTWGWGTGASSPAGSSPSSPRSDSWSARAERLCQSLSRVFRSRVFSAANVSIVITATILGLELLGMSLFLQQAWHWSTTDTGLAIAPGPRRF